ncbi:hypothetical protein AB6A40_006746 [Gnathostoma spinigerum]|uniref:Saposin B-type domain-containing protein n=1 Tax=Gnathostoma spinigerum TaxID=75299 RepID=A0ABD6ELG1_9BILA
MQNAVANAQTYCGLCKLAQWGLKASAYVNEKIRAINKQCPNFLKVYLPELSQRDKICKLIKTELDAVKEEVNDVSSICLAIRVTCLFKC